MGAPFFFDRQCFGAILLIPEMAPLAKAISQRL